jgi:iron-sulfur cluster assembly accessory protein
MLMNYSFGLCWLIVICHNRTMITLTDDANLHLSSTVNENNLEGISLSVRGGGCSGFNYDWQPLEKLKVEEIDYVIDLDSGKLVVDGTSLFAIAGMTIDYKKDLFGSKLMLTNPNTKSMCGCGESFSI